MTTNNSGMLLDAADLGLNLDRALASVRHMRGGPARTLGLTFLAAALGLTPFVWYFDVQPTIAFMSSASSTALDALPASLAIVAPVIGILINFLPTLFEFTLPRLAAQGVKLASVMAYGAAVFDAITDWPRVATTMDGAWPTFTSYFSAGLVGPIWGVSRLALLFLATIGFEMAWTLLVICGLVLIVNGLRRAPATQGGQP